MLLLPCVLALPGGTATATHAGQAGVSDACAGSAPCWWVYRGTWQHFHTRNMYVWNGVRYSSYSWHALRDAVSNWHYNTILNLNFVNDWRQARIRVFDTNEPRDYCGLAYPPSHQYAYNNVILANQCMNRDYTHARGTACQEIGHELGLGHANGDCMGQSYHVGFWRSLPYPSTASYNAINWGYRQTGH